MASLNIPHSFSNGNVANATEVNANFAFIKAFVETETVQKDGSVLAPTSAIADGAITTDKILNGTIMDVDINASAGIAPSKIGAGALPATVTVASANIVNGTIVAEDIASSAITKEKIGSGPRGIIAYASIITGDPTITTQEIQLSTPSFTAVAGRYYRITYYEPLVSTSATVGSHINASIYASFGPVLETALVQNPRATSDAYYSFMNLSLVTTLPAGPTVINATLQSNLGTGQATRTSEKPAWLCVEDIGTL